ncbi:MAG: hypothetical protein PHF09_01535 [Candidatus Nanoarchaeia archaeon]|nr:hypothetical protein [Candidatus Nanoarchaeia archaeon]
MNKLKKIILISLLIFIILYSINYFLSSTNQSKELNLEKEISFNQKLNNSIKLGIDFLHNTQLENGEFKTESCFEKKMINCYYDSSPFVTTFVLYSINEINNPKVQEIKEKALNFLLNEQENGLWSYWTKKNENKLYFDLDDTSCSSFILKQNNISFQENIPLIKNNKNNESLYYTWIDPIRFENDIDCAVNVNVLLYLQENDPAVCSYINNAINNDKTCSVYYPDKLTLYYLVSRAYKNNITCLNQTKEKIISEILSNYKQKKTFENSLQTALIINTLMNFGYNDKKILETLIGDLIKNQNKNGSWKKSSFYIQPQSINYGSEELTTAISIEALNNYQKL